MKTALKWLVVAHLAMANLANGQAKDPWIGRRVFTQYGTVLKVGDAVVDDEGRTADITASGRDRRDVRVYRVEHTNGEWLWLKAEKSGVAGWVRSKYVIPCEQAIDFYTNQIRARPTAALYNARGSAWSEKKEYDIAIADYNEAFRVEPSEPIYIYNRGGAWSSKKEFDKAIADFNEAIRLDPKFASAYLNRGAAWGEKKEFDKAIADFNEAIRLDPRHASAYLNRGTVWGEKKEYDKAIAEYSEAIRLDPGFASAYGLRAWIWATCPDEKYRDGKKAVESATRACELSEWEDGYILGNLAAAYAEIGEFDKALEWQEKAHKAYSDEDKKKWQKLLDLYREKKPYRDTD